MEGKIKDYFSSVQFKQVFEVFPTSRGATGETSCPVGLYKAHECRSADEVPVAAAGNC